MALTDKQTDRQTKSQTFTTENNTTLAARMVKCSAVVFACVVCCLTVNWRQVARSLCQRSFVFSFVNFTGFPPTAPTTFLNNLLQMVVFVMQNQTVFQSVVEPGAGEQMEILVPCTYKCHLSLRRLFQVQPCYSYDLSCKASHYCIVIHQMARTSVVEAAHVFDTQKHAENETSL